MPNLLELRTAVKLECELYILCVHAHHSFFVFSDRFKLQCDKVEL